MGASNASEVCPQQCAGPGIKTGGKVVELAAFVKIQNDIIT